MTGAVVGVHASDAHTFSKARTDAVRLVEGFGVEGDAHFGATVQHRSRVAIDPTQPNLRQVHLIQAELFDHLRNVGHDVRAGQLGENITTRGINLLALPVGTRLHIGSAVITLTGLRNPCEQINRFQPGLLSHVVHEDEDGTLHRLVGVMGIVSRSGRVTAGQQIEVDLPPEPHTALTRV